MLLTQTDSRSVYFDPKSIDKTFYFDSDTTAINNTQSFNVDWSKFENHTFFGSAAANVNIAFNKIVNGYPYDGTFEQVSTFLQSLSGFENWVLTQIPTWTGHILLSSSYITVADRVGALFSGNANSIESGVGVLSPNSSSFSVELYVKPLLDTPLQVLAQHKGIDDIGWTLYVTASSVANSCSLGFSVTSDNFTLNSEALLQLNSFNHVCCVYNADDTLTNLKLFVNGNLKNTSSGSIKTQLNIFQPNLYIGSGSSFLKDDFISYIPDATFSGSIDEFRFWKRALTKTEINNSLYKNVFAQNDLIAYFRFNEPPTVSGYASSSFDLITLDSSGNSLHGILSDFNGVTKITSSVDLILTEEKSTSAPVLFPEYADTIVLKNNLLSTGSLYDNANPNNILKLIPQHYLEEARKFDGMINNGTLHTNNNNKQIPGTNVLGSTQLIVSLLYTIARFFDNIKLGIDNFVTINDVNYDEFDTCPDIFLNDALNNAGLSDIPKLFSDATLNQFNFGDDISNSTSQPAKNVRNSLLRRFMTNLPDILSSKGTLHSIESTLRSMGIDPNASIKLKERGGHSETLLRNTFEIGNNVASFIKTKNNVILKSLPLSGSRIESGWPDIAGAFVNQTDNPPFGVSNNVSDGLYTSGSWSVLATYCWPSGSLLLTQSLMRLNVTGSNTEHTMLNVIFTNTNSEYGDITLYARPSYVSGSELTSLTLTNVPLLNKVPWRIGVNYIREDKATDLHTSASYTLCAGAFNDILFSTSSFVPIVSNNSYNIIDSTYNASGSNLTIGGNLPINTITGFLNDATVNSIAKITNTDCEVTQIQFWSKAISEEEFSAQANSVNSFASNNPLLNSDGAMAINDGSFEKIRLDIGTKLSPTDRISKTSTTLRLFDNSKFDRHIDVTNIQQNIDIGHPIVVNYKRFPSIYDEAITNQNTRILNSNSYIGNLNSTRIPDPRFAIELSLVESLNRAMLDSIANTDLLANAIGTTESMFSPDYPILDALSATYFVRLVSKLDFKQYFGTYRWIESLIGTIAQQLIPMKAIFNGTTFIVESHAFERAKIEYRNVERYLTTLSTDFHRDSLYLQQIAGNIKR